MINFCGNCGRKLNPEDNVCPNCGWRKPESSSTTQTSSSTTESSTGSSPDKISPAPSSDQVKRANIFFWLIIGLYASPLLAGIFVDLLQSTSSFVLNSLATALSWVSSLAALIALILVIYSKITFKFSKKIQILFWVVLGLILLRIVYFIFVLFACTAMLTLL